MLEKFRQLRAQLQGDRDNGFTLIELLVVVVIIGILIAIAIPLYLNYEKGAKDKSAASDVRGAISVLEQCNTDNSTYPTGLTAVTGGYTACTNQTIKVTSGTTLTYTPSAATGTVASYILNGYNSGGQPKYYCYNSANGGSVTTVATATTTC